MTSTRLVLALSVSCLLVPMGALADRDHDDDGHGRRHHRHHHHERGEYKEEFWDGPCKVERKYKRNGDFKEERKCKGAPAVMLQPQVVHVPQPVYVQPAPVMVEPGVVIQGTVRVR